MRLCLSVFLIFCILRWKETATGGDQLKLMLLKILQKLTEKRMCWSLFFNEIASGA